MKPLCVDLPYPTVDEKIIDPKATELVLNLYAGKKSELTATLQYVYHSVFFGEENKKEIADLLLSIAICEMEHIEILANLLLSLSTKPIYAVNRGIGCDYYNTSEIAYSTTPKKMILDDIAGEMEAVNEYTFAINCIKNEEVCAVLTRIRMDEELHILALKEVLAKL